MRVTVAPDRKLRAVLHCGPCPLFVAVFAAGFFAYSLRVLECSYGVAVSFPSGGGTSTGALTAAPIKQRPLTAAAPSYPLLPLRFQLCPPHPGCLTSQSL